MDIYLEKAYNDAFSSVYDQMMLRKEMDPEFTKEYLQGLLESLYVQQGNNWEISEAKGMTLNATVAVCEILLREWE